MIEINNLVKKYGDHVAVDDLSLMVEPGKIYGFLGPNGAGKSTTMNIITGYLGATSGEVKINGHDIFKEPEEAKKCIGYLPEIPPLYVDMTVREYLDFVAELKKLEKSLRKRYVEEAIAFVGLEDFVNFYPKKLSGGLLRRLNIACGIAHKPKLIIMDEPTVAVDPQSRNKILEGIVQLNREGATIIYTSHYMEEVEQICTRIAIMDKGKNIALGTKEELIKLIKKSEIITMELVDLPEEDLAHIRTLPHVYQADYKDHTLTVLCDGGKHNLVRILDYLQEKDLSIGHVYSQLPTLNDVFLEITGKALRD